MQRAVPPEHIVVDESGRTPRVVSIGAPKRESLEALLSF